MSCFCPVCESRKINDVMPVKSWVEHHLGLEKSRHSVRVEFMLAHDNLGMEYVLECGDCGFTYVAPYPSSEALSGYYSNYAVERGVERAEARLPRYMWRINRLAKPGMQSFLDVGTNVGTTAEAARRVKFSATGIDLDGAALREAHRMFPDNEYIHTSVEEHQDTVPAVKYDFIWGSEVIEHSPDPVCMVKALRNLVSEKGMVFLTTPNVGAMLRPNNILDWKHFHYPEHISLFTKQSMRIVLENNGFQNVHFRPYLGTRIHVTAEPS